MILKGYRMKPIRLAFTLVLVLAAAGARGAVAMESVLGALDGLAGYAVPAAAR